MDLPEKAELARQGDKEAFVYLIKAVQQSLFVIARSIVKNDEDCADAMQMLCRRPLPKLFLMYIR